MTPMLVEDLCRQAGLHPHAFRSLFPTEGAFLDAINDSLVEECSSRLRACISQFQPSQEGNDPLVEASVAMASSWPLTRGGVLIRANRRVRGLVDDEDGLRIAAAERRFVGALMDIFSDLMVRLDRSFSWPPILAVRVILDTYERSFEMWVLSGNDETVFSSSSYAQRTLPTLLREMSAPAGSSAIDLGCV